MNSQLMNFPGQIPPTDMLKDILDIPDLLKRIYDRYILHDSPSLQQAAVLLKNHQPVIMTGMVTSEYGAYPASILLNRGGIVNSVYETAELLHYYLPVIRKSSSLVVISQSGESAEVVRLLETMGGTVPTVGIFNSEDSFLAKESQIGLPLLAGLQRACGTKTNLATVAVMLLLAEAALSPDHKPKGEPIKKLINQINHLTNNWRVRFNSAADFLEGASVYEFLGRGPGLVSAKFSAVLFREVLKCVANGMSTASFRHGIFESTRCDHRVIIFAPQGGTFELSIQFALHLLEYQIPVMIVTNREPGLKPNELLYILQTDPSDECWSPVIDMLPFQFIGHILAERQGLVPGKLLRASYVTTRE